MFGSDRLPFTELGKYLEEHYINNANRSLGRVQRNIRYLEDYFRGHMAKDITTAKINSYIAHRKKLGKANATVNNELRSLKTMLRLAVDYGRLQKAPKFKLLKEDNVIRLQVLPILSGWHMIGRNNVKSFEHACHVRNEVRHKGITINDCRRQVGQVKTLYLCDRFFIICHGKTHHSVFQISCETRIDRF